jgi:excisionase family DNA binding protein
LPITVDNEEFLSVEEACEYLGGITRQTLRNRTKAAGISAYKQGISRNVYYKKSDLDSLKAFRPVDPDEDKEERE